MDGTIAPDGRNDLYEADEHAWLLRQVALLRDGRHAELDAANLVEYLESMARRDRRELRSRLVILLMHLLKFRVQPERAGWSWTQTVLTQQDELRDILAGAPSMAQHLPEMLAAAFDQARRLAAAETALPLARFPDDNPWTLDEALHWKPPERAE